ncbi:MAG: hypothetical protein JNM17_01110 [Archangium sp.]|nr:hypothetical protein [Archangium sp.]
MQLWLHLIERSVGYHWEDDPADYKFRDGRPCFSDAEVEILRRHNDSISGNEIFEHDACRLFKFATTLGSEMVDRFDITDADTIHASYERLRRARWTCQNLRRRRNFALAA